MAGCFRTGSEGPSADAPKHDELRLSPANGPLSVAAPTVRPSLLLRLPTLHFRFTVRRRLKEGRSARGFLEGEG